MSNADLVRRPPEANEVTTLVKSMEGQFKQALPKMLSAERFTRIAMTTLRTSPNLLKCDRASLLGALMVSAQLGLEPGGPGGRAYLIPYGTTCQFIVGYRGLVELAYRHQAVKSVEARVVREGDEFRLSYGVELELSHTPSLRGGGEMVGCYAVVRLRDADPIVEWMDRAQIEAIRTRSRSGKSGPWVTDFDEMARKTVLRRALKYAPSLVEVSDGLSAEDTGATWSPDTREIVLSDAETGEVREPGQD